MVHSELEFHLNLTGGIPAYAFALLLGSSVREAASAPLGVDQRYRTMMMMTGGIDYSSTLR